MKQIILVAILFVFTLSSWAQTHLQLSFTAGPSVNWMKTTADHVTGQNVVLGYDFGIMGDVFFSTNEHYSLLTGLQVVNTGGKVSYRADQSFPFAGETLDPSVDIRYRLRYMEVPLSLKLKTNEFHRVYYWGIFGLSPMINIGATGVSSDGLLNKESIHKEVNLFNLAMNIGAGFDFELGSDNSVSAALIFQNGLIDVTTDNYFTDKTIINSLKVRLALIF